MIVLKVLTWTLLILAPFPKLSFSLEKSPMLRTVHLLEGGTGQMIRTVASHTGKNTVTAIVQRDILSILVHNIFVKDATEYC